MYVFRQQRHTYSELELYEYEFLLLESSLM